MSDDFPYLGEHDRFAFPDPHSATPEGIVAAGGNLSPGMLLSAYRQGLFPWYDDTSPILWWSPDPRMVVFPNEITISKSMRRVFNRGRFSITADTAFAEVIQECADTDRPGQAGTWITQDVIDGYRELFRLGYAHSIEAWDGNELAGGLYGVCLGTVFFGESMFSRQSNASKAAFLSFVTRFRSRKSPVQLSLIDSQVYTPHMESLGAREIGRSAFYEALAAGLAVETVAGKWTNVSFET